MSLLFHFSYPSANEKKTPKNKEKIFFLKIRKKSTFITFESTISLTCFSEWQPNHACDKNKYWNWIEMPCQHHLASVQLLYLNIH